MEKILYIMKSTDRETPDNRLLASDNERIAEMISPPLTPCGNDNDQAEDNDKGPLSTVSCYLWLLHVAVRSFYNQVQPNW